MTRRSRSRSLHAISEQGGDETSEDGGNEGTEGAEEYEGQDSGQAVADEEDQVARRAPPRKYVASTFTAASKVGKKLK
jgi:hypothetical protein